MQGKGANIAPHMKIRTAICSVPGLKIHGVLRGKRVNKGPVIQVKILGHKNTVVSETNCHKDDISAGAFTQMFEAIGIQLAQQIKYLGNTKISIRVKGKK